MTQNIYDDPVFLGYAQPRRSTFGRAGKFVLPSVQRFMIPNNDSVTSQNYTDVQ